MLCPDIDYTKGYPPMCKILNKPCHVNYCLEQVQKYLLMFEGKVLTPEKIEEIIVSMMDEQWRK